MARDGFGETLGGATQQRGEQLLPGLTEHLLGLAQGLSAHIRKEERQLFERVQELMNAAELTDLGARLEDALRDATQACALPNEATKLRTAK